MSKHSGRANQIFISYRREDSAAITGRIYDRLTQEFGRDAIFKDVDSIPLGVNFRKHLDAIVSECAVFIAVIGDRWMARIDDPRDFVRIEIESALRRNIPVIPLLVQNASLPPEESLPESLRELSDRNGTTIGHDPHFNADISRLINSLKALLEETAVASPGVELAPVKKAPGDIPRPSNPPQKKVESVLRAAFPPERLSSPPLKWYGTRLKDVWRIIEQIFNTKKMTLALAVIFGAGSYSIAVFLFGMAGLLFNELTDTRNDPYQIAFGLIVAELCMPLIVGAIGYYWGHSRPDIEWTGGIWVSAFPFVSQALFLIALPSSYPSPYPPRSVITYTVTLLATLMMPFFSSVGWYLGRLESMKKK